MYLEKCSFLILFALRFAFRYGAAPVASLATPESVAFLNAFAYNFPDVFLFLYFSLSMNRKIIIASVAALSAFALFGCQQQPAAPAPAPASQPQTESSTATLTITPATQEQTSAASLSVTPVTPPTAPVPPTAPTT
jgi:hypothetical protein